jgi:hypothetical protein
VWVLESVLEVQYIDKTQEHSEVIRVPRNGSEWGSVPGRLCCNDKEGSRTQDSPAQMVAEARDTSDGGIPVMENKDYEYFMFILECVDTNPTPLQLKTILKMVEWTFA